MNVTKPQLTATFHTGREVLTSALELSRQSEHVSAEIQRFLDTVRVA